MSGFRHQQPLADEQIALLEAVKPHILREAESFDMEYFSQCGSPSCIAGHIVALIDPGKLAGDDFVATESVANLALGIESIWSDVPLFYGEMWDRDLFNDYLWYSVRSLKLERAQVAIKAIDRYIANTKAYFLNE